MDADPTQPPAGGAPIGFRFDYGLDGTPMQRGELQAVTYCDPSSKLAIAKTGEIPRETFNAYIWPMLMDAERTKFARFGYCVHSR